MARLLLPTCATVAIALLVSAVPTRAHEYWLAPRALAGDSIAIGAAVGTGFRGEPLPYRSDRTVRFELRSDRTRDLIGVDGALEWVRLAEDRGGMMVAYQSDFAAITLDVETFRTYVAEEGFEDVLATQGVSEPVRERYRRCAKAWLGGVDARRATRPLGLPLEVVPEAAPGTNAVLPIRVLWQGRPLAGALLKAWRAPLDSSGVSAAHGAYDSIGLIWQARTDKHGRAVAPVATEGLWMISVVQLARARDRRLADWESTWASLTFVRPAPR